MRDPLLATCGAVVGFYEREFYCFSNFSSFAIVWNGHWWPTSEHAYQAAKFRKNHPEIVEEIRHASSAHEAYKLARKYADKVHPDWNIEKIGIMKDIVSHKLRQHPYIQKKLLQTGNKQIVEDSPVDSFWGWGPNRDGRNELGKIWMKLRATLAKS